MFKTIFKVVASSVAKMAPHKLRAFASKSTKDTDRARELSPRADAILRNTRCISNPTRSYNQHQNALNQLKQNLRALTMKSAEERLEDYRIRAERGEDVPELEHFTVMDLELGLHLEREHWRGKGNTFLCAEGIKEDQVRKWIADAKKGIKEPSRGDEIDVFEV